jgi:hypothetical protein
MQQSCAARGSLLLWNDRISDGGRAGETPGSPTRATPLTALDQTLGRDEHPTARRRRRRTAPSMTEQPPRPSSPSSSLSGQPQPRDRLTLAWLPSAAGGNAEPAKPRLRKVADNRLPRARARVEAIVPPPAAGPFGLGESADSPAAVRADPRTVAQSPQSTRTGPPATKPRCREAQVVIEST